MQTNLNMLFQDLLPSYGHLIRRNTPMTKEEFITALKEQYDCTGNHRNNLFLYSVKDSKFETVVNQNGAAIFT
jgi:hypothetical protein